MNQRRNNKYMAGTLSLYDWTPPPPKVKGEPGPKPPTFTHRVLYGYGMPAFKDGNKLGLRARTLLAYTD